jgi:hypothetical protein
MWDRMHGKRSITLPKAVIMEGNHCYPPGTQCNTQRLILPVWEYSHENGNRSITGGRIYRGTRMPELVGAYIYADFVSGRIWALTMQDGSRLFNENTVKDQRKMLFLK